jgi:hypothetical protein
VRELIRTATLHATLAGSDVVTDAHLDRAVTELLDSGPVTPRLHGIGAQHADDLDTDLEYDLDDG